jgi:hypothetical protein
MTTSQQHVSNFWCSAPVVPRGGAGHDLALGRHGGRFLAYFNTARYLRGEIPASELRAPFIRCWRGAGAAWGDSRQSFALLNWLASAPPPP